jgi:hypothetical protein
MSSVFKEGISITWLDNFGGRLINAWHWISLKRIKNNEKGNVRGLWNNTVVCLNFFILTSLRCSYHFIHHSYTFFVYNYRILLLLLEPIRWETKRGTAGLQLQHPKSKFKKEKKLGYDDVNFCKWFIFRSKSTTKIGRWLVQWDAGEWN